MAEEEVKSVSNAAGIQDTKEQGSGTRDQGKTKNQKLKTKN